MYMCSFVTYCTVQALSAARSLEEVDIEVVTRAVIGQASSDVILSYLVFPPTADCKAIRARIALKLGSLLSFMIINAFL